METSKLPRTKNFTQSEFRLLLGKQLIDGFSVRKYEPKVEPIFIGPGNPNTPIKNHENTRMPSAHGKLCKTHRDHFSKTQCTVYGCLICNVHLCKFCHLKWHGS